MRECVLDTDYGRLAGLRAGHPGDIRVLALHGWLDNAASFVPLAAHLPGLDLVALDLPGHGASAHLPAGAEYSLAGTVNAVLDAADALGWEHFGVLGHSMGAGLGSILSAAAPERVTRLLAIEALGALSDHADRTAQRLRDWVAARRALASKRLRVFPDIDTAMRARMQVNGLSEPAARLLVERGLRPTSDETPAGFVWSTDQRLTFSIPLRMIESQVQDLLAHIECPVRVIYAAPAQRYFPEPLRSERVAVLKHGELIVLDGGHHLHMEQPNEVAAAIGDFFVRSD